MTDKTAFIRDEVQALMDQGLYNTIRTIEGPQGNPVDIAAQFGPQSGATGRPGY